MIWWKRAASCLNWAGRTEFWAFPNASRSFEVGPRDGLQNEPESLPLAIKVALIEKLAASGLTTIEAGAFVSPKWVPQMAETAAVLAALPFRPGIRYPVLVPNMKGFEAAKAAGAREIAVFGAALGELFGTQYQLFYCREFRAVSAGGRGRGRGRHRPSRLCLLRAGLPLRGQRCPAARGRGGQSSDRPRLL